VACALTVPVHVQGEAPCPSGKPRGRATWLRSRGWWGRSQLDAKDGGGVTPLMHAGFMGHMDVVRWLVDQGAALNEQDRTGFTALTLASWEGKTPIVKLLVERGADPTVATDVGSTPLMGASLSGHVEVVRFLLGHPIARATINQRSSDGATALWSACFGGRGGTVRLLLESGADPTIARTDGTTPMAIAQIHTLDNTRAEGRRECVALLEVRESFLFLP
jgi:ankyrin repeat protein